MHEPALIITLTSGLAVALVLGYITQRAGLSPIVGYLLAGLVVGPNTPGFVADRNVASEFAELGVILLMFGVGLHFHLKDLLAVRNIAIVGALGQIAVATFLGALLGRGLGWSLGASLVFGLALSVASTVMLTRVLVDNHALQTPTGRIAIGWLVVEDIFTVIVLVLLPSIFAQNGEAVSIPQALLMTVGKLVLLCLFAFLIGGRLIPRILNDITATQSRELFTLTVLVLALGIAVGSALVFGVSMALGAFLAGMIVGQSEFSFRAASDALPMRDAFAVLFFVSVGMLFDPAALMASPSLLVATLAIILVGKPLAAFFIVTLLGYGSHLAIGVAVALAQIGEFSLILATLGDQLGILPDGATNVMVASSIVSLSLNPLVYRSVGRLESKLRASGFLWKLLNRRSTTTNPATEDAASSAYRAVVVGFGPISQTVARLLRDGNIEPVVVEMNLETIRRIRSQGYPAVYGDAAQSDVLEAAGIRKAVALVVSGPTAEQGTEIIRIARSLNPNVRVLARSNYLRETARMRQAGADEVFAGEGEVALAMTEHILGALGATPEQIDRERQRVREEVFRISRGSRDETQMNS
jgi:CPA2 family monovalent cation:H+ antiporter-2